MLTAGKNNTLVPSLEELGIKPLLQSPLPSFIEESG